MQAERLIDSLNAAESEPEHAEVMRIFGLCRQLDELRKTAPPMPYPSEPTPKIFSYEIKASRLLTAVNDALGKFQFRPALGGRYRVNWLPARPHAFTDSEVKRAQQSGKLPTPPLAAVQLLLEMLEAGTLDRIRQCFCGRWFFATTNKKRVCSDACRFQKFNDQRAEYMKEYRKNPRVKAKRRDHERPKRK